VTRAIFTSAARLSLMPSILFASAVGVIGSTVAFRALGADAGFWNLRPPAMTGLVLVLALRYWLWTCIATTALSMRRANLRWRPLTFVSLPVAFEAGAMSLLLAVPTLAALFLLIVPGVYVALRWSQAPLLILDGEAHWIRAADESANLISGRYPAVLGVWLVLGAVLVTAGWIADVFSQVLTSFGTPSLVARGPVVVPATLGNALVTTTLASTYYELHAA
jgi:hypothetical protein